MAAASWFSGLIIMLAVVMPTSGVIDGRCSVMTVFPSPWCEKFCGVGLFITQYLIPITVFITCYGRIFLFLRSRVSPQGQTSGNEPKEPVQRGWRGIHTPVGNCTWVTPAPERRVSANPDYIHERHRIKNCSLIRYETHTFFKYHPHNYEARLKRR
ncbi:hypothetical protein LSAT2_024769 [Lamellibrachia satsuma]|nr:hypothetical protein LSAT2_024769 [Lamellibrachia satsuma]